MIGDNKKNLKSRSWKLKANKGFTMVELLVAVAIFTLVVTIATDIYFSAVGSQRESFGKQDVLDASRYIMESMGRAVRQSIVVNATGSSLEISHPDKGTIVYELSEGNLLESGISLNPESVIVEDLTFVVDGLSSGDGAQPRVTILLTLASNVPNPSEQVELTLQTTITPRKLE